MQYTHAMSAASYAHLKLFPSLEKHQTFLFLVAVLQCTVCLPVDAACLLQTVLIVHRQLKLCKAQPHLQRLTLAYYNNV